MNENISEKRASFLKDVEHEIRALKQNASRSELRKLDFYRLDPSSKSRCIYGQLSGSCDNERAKELMDSSCIRVMNLPEGEVDANGKDIDDPRFTINGEYSGQTWKPSMWGSRTYSYLSVLEAYIATKNANNKGILVWLRGETDNFPNL